MEKDLKRRNSIFELVRMIAILMIIFSHYSVHGGVNAADLPFGLNSIVLNLSQLGNLGVVIFMMISGFFMVNSTKFNVEKAVRIALQSFFYIILFFFISLSLGEIQFSWKEFYKTFFFLFFGMNWFVVNYLIIYIFHPFINKLLKSLSNKEMTVFILLLYICWSIIPTFTLGSFEMNNLVSMFTIYCFGAFLSFLEKGNSKFFTKKIGMWLIIVNSAILVLSVVFINFIGSKVVAINEYSTHFLSRSSVFVIALSAGIVIFCANAKPFYFRPINFVASFTLGIYLIHDNANFKSYMWRELIRVPEYATGNLLIPHLLISVCVIFIASLIIDSLRYYLLEKPAFFFGKKLYYFFSNKIALNKKVLNSK